MKGITRINTKFHGTDLVINFVVILGRKTPSYIRINTLTSFKYIGVILHTFFLM